MITGTSHTRLNELKKYKDTDNFYEMYRIYNSLTNDDGVDYDESNPNSEIIYYIRGIRYVDNINNNTTTFSLTSDGINDESNFIEKKIYKDGDMMKIIDKPKVFNDIFINRGGVSVFNKIYGLEYIEKMIHLTTYAGGRFYNIKQNF